MVLDSELLMVGSVGWAGLQILHGHKLDTCVGQRRIVILQKEEWSIAGLVYATIDWGHSRL